MCENAAFLTILFFLKTIIEIIGIFVPIILILMLTIDFLKGVVVGKEQMEKATRRIIFSVLVFLVPVLINLSLSLVSTENQINTFTTCLKDANPTNISMWKEVGESVKREKKALFDLELEKARVQRAQMEEERRKKALANLETGEIANRDLNTCYYFQGDYKAYPYGGYGTIASHGCGPTSCAVIGCTLLNSPKINPVNATNSICAVGGCTSSGTTFGGLQQYLRKLGLNVSGIMPNTPANRQKADQALARGGMVLVLAKRGIFTGGGHYFVINKDLGETYQIVEVGNRGRTNKTWPKNVLWGSDAHIVQFFTVTK